MKKILLAFLIFCATLLFACEENISQDFTLDYTEIYTEFEEPIVTWTEDLVNSFETLPAPVLIDVDFEVDTNSDGSFTIKTNLPTETELSLTLSGKGYLAQGKAYVDDGIAVSERFTNRGAQLIGEYTLEVLMPIPSVQTDYVKHFIGNSGEYLTGPYIKGALGSVVASKEFKINFSASASDTSTVISQSATDVSYYRTPNGKKYHIDKNCGGENSYLTDDIFALSPCSKCIK